MPELRQAGNDAAGFRNDDSFPPATGKLEGRRGDIAATDILGQRQAKQFLFDLFFVHDFNLATHRAMSTGNNLT